MGSTTKTWYVKAKDKIVCSISNAGKVQIFIPDLVPFDLYLEETEDFSMLLNNVLNFNWWCGNRVLSLDRTHAKNILNAVGLKQAKTDADRAMVSLSLNCVSLRDFYWVTENPEDKWDNYNLFSKHLRDIVDIALLGKNLTVTNTELVCNDISTDGVAPKAWVRKDNGFSLYKTGPKERVHNEVQASAALTEIGFKVLKYELIMYQGEEVSKCQCFTNENRGFVTAGNYNMNYDLQELVYDRFKDEFWTMILCDYLVGNSDRHQDNWGFMFDENRDIVGLCPIFDFDHAFEAKEEYFCLPLQLLDRFNVTMEAAADIAIQQLKVDIEYLLSFSTCEYVKQRLLRLKELELSNSSRITESSSTFLDIQEKLKKQEEYNNNR